MVKKEEIPKTGDLRWRVTVVDRIGKWGSYKVLTEKKVLEQYSGVAWRTLPEFYEIITVS